MRRSVVSKMIIKQIRGCRSTWIYIVTDEDSVNVREKCVSVIEASG